jgi:hypothetical protein
VISLPLNYYNQWLIRSVGTYPTPVFQQVWAETGNKTVYRSYHGMEYTIPIMIKGLVENSGGVGAKRLFKPEFFEERKAEALHGKGKKIKVVKPILDFKDGKVKPGYNVSTRGNGVDAAKWPEDLMVHVVI